MRRTIDRHTVITLTLALPLDTYSHVAPAMHAAAARRMDTLFGVG